LLYYIASKLVRGEEAFAAAFRVSTRLGSQLGTPSPLSPASNKDTRIFQEKNHQHRLESVIILNVGLLRTVDGFSICFGPLEGLFPPGWLKRRPESVSRQGSSAMRRWWERNPMLLLLCV